VAIVCDVGIVAVLIPHQLGVSLSSIGAGWFPGFAALPLTKKTPGFLAIKQTGKNHIVCKFKPF